MITATEKDELFKELSRLLEECRESLAEIEHLANATIAHSLELGATVDINGNISWPDLDNYKQECRNKIEDFQNNINNKPYTRNL